MNDVFRKKIVVYYCIIFYLLMIYKWLNGLFLFQLRPSFFYTRQDIFTWLFMQTGLHQWLLNNKPGWILADILFYSLPAIYLLVHRYSVKLSVATGFIMLLVNWCYVECYTLYPINSIEAHLAWLLFPVLFITTSTATFAFLFEGLRYMFLYLFMSAALWKLWEGSIFNIHQMSGVLLFQHSQQLTNSPNYWQSKLYLWLINHETVSYILFLLAFLAELSFIIGFFTKRFDKWLFALFVLFLLMDHFIMRIPYYELSPFLLTLLYKPAQTAVKN